MLKHILTTFLERHSFRARSNYGSPQHMKTLKLSRVVFVSFGEEFFEHIVTKHRFNILQSYERTTNT